MEDVINFSFDINVFSDVVVDELEILVPEKVSNILHTSCEKIIYTDDSVSFVSKSVTEMRAKKASSAGNDTNRLGGICHG